MVVVVIPKPLTVTNSWFFGLRGTLFASKYLNYSLVSLTRDQTIFIQHNFWEYFSIYNSKIHYCKTTWLWSEYCHWPWLAALVSATWWQHSSAGESTPLWPRPWAGPPGWRLRWCDGLTRWSLQPRSPPAWWPPWSQTLSLVGTRPQSQNNPASASPALCKIACPVTEWKNGFWENLCLNEKNKITREKST